MGDEEIYLNNEQQGKTKAGPFKGLKFKILLITIFFIVFALTYGGLSVLEKQIGIDKLVGDSSSVVEKKDSDTKVAVIPDLKSCYSTFSPGLLPDKIGDYWRGPTDLGSNVANASYFGKEDVWNGWWGQAFPEFVIEARKVTKNIKTLDEVIKGIKDSDFKSRESKIVEKKYGGLPAVLGYTSDLSEEEKQVFGSIFSTYIFYKSKNMTINFSLLPRSSETFEDLKNKNEELLSDWGNQICAINEVKSRDQKRKEDLKKIANALEKYKKDKGTYPSSDYRAGRIVETDNYEPIEPNRYITDAIFMQTMLKYMTTIPLDPSLNGWYGYKGGGKTYELIANLENKKSPDCKVNGSRCVYKIVDGKVKK